MIGFRENKHCFALYFGLLFLSSLPFTSIGNDIFIVNGQSTESTSLQELKPAPQYCANTLDEKVSCLEDYKGKPILVNVWATWCIPCREEMPTLQQLYSEYKDKGLEIVGVSLNNIGMDNRIKRFTDRMNITYSIWHDPDESFTRTFKTIGVPESFLLDKNGTLIYQWKGQFDPLSSATKSLVENALLKTSASDKIVSSEGLVILNNTDNSDASLTGSSPKSGDIQQNDVIKI